MKLPRLTEVFHLKEAGDGSANAKQASEILYDFSFEYHDPSSKQELDETMLEAQKFVRAHPNPASEPEKVLHDLVQQWTTTKSVDEQLLQRIVSIVRQMKKEH
jgi:hypothetical protein